MASIGDGRQLKNGRELAAWIGLVPRQRSSGGKIRLVGIGKRAHRYLRTLLIDSVEKRGGGGRWLSDRDGLTGR